MHGLDAHRVGPLPHQVVGQGQQALAVTMADEVMPLLLAQGPGAVGRAEGLDVLAEFLQVAIALQDVSQRALQRLGLLRFRPAIGEVAGQRQPFVAEGLGDHRAGQQQLRILLLFQQHDEPRLGGHRFAGCKGGRQRDPKRLRAGRAGGQVPGENLVDLGVVLLRQLGLGVIDRRGVRGGRRNHRRQSQKPSRPRQAVHRWLAFCWAISTDALRTGSHLSEQPSEQPFWRAIRDRPARRVPFGRAGDCCRNPGMQTRLIIAAQFTDCKTLAEISPILCATATSLPSQYKLMPQMLGILDRMA